mgnify:CR=1 FL=1
MLYDWLYYDSREMAKYVEEQKVNATRFGVREEIVQAGVLKQDGAGSEVREEKVFFEDGFDVKAFHDRYVKPALFRYHSKKLRKLKRTFTRGSTLLPSRSNRFKSTRKLIMIFKYTSTNSTIKKREIHAISLHPSRTFIKAP